MIQRSCLAGRRRPQCPRAPAASARGQQQVPAASMGPRPRGGPGFQIHMACGPGRPHPAGWNLPAQWCQVGCTVTVPSECPLPLRLLCEGLCTLCPHTLPGHTPQRAAKNRASHTKTERQATPFWGFDFTLGGHTRQCSGAEGETPGSAGEGTYEAPSQLLSPAVLLPTLVCIFEPHLEVLRADAQICGQLRITPGDQAQFLGSNQDRSHARQAP